MSRRLQSLFRTHPNTVILTTTLFTTSITLAYFLDTHILTLSRIHGPSMSPALSPTYAATGQSDWVLLQKYQLTPRILLDYLQRPSDARRALPHARAHLRRGDIVAYGKAHDPSGAAVKRVLALGGDRVVRHRDAARRAREDIEARKLGLLPLPDALVVPQNHVWVESDNHTIATLDSNVFGPVPVNLVLGRVERVVWPPARRGLVPPRAGRPDAQETRVVRSAAVRYLGSEEGLG